MAGEERNEAAASGPVGAALGQLETLVKLGALALAVLTFLGFPAVFVQFRQLSIPLEFLPKDLALRAGILPSLVLLLLAVFGYLSSRPVPAHGPKSNHYVLGIALFVVIAMALAVLLQAVLPSGWLKAFPFGGDKLPFWEKKAFALVLAVFLKKQIEKSRLVARAIDWVGSRRLGENWIAVPVIFTVAVFITVVLAPLFLTVGSSKEIDYMGRARAGAYVAIAMGLIMFMLSWREWMLSKDADVKVKKGKILFFVTMAILYLYVVILYSSRIYQRSPYAIGGGEPSRVKLLIDAKAFTSGMMNGLHNAGQSRDEKAYMFDAYLIYADSTEVIVTSAEDKQAGGIVLSRSSVLAIQAKT